VNGLSQITVEVLHANLLSIADEMFFALMRSAYSTNIKERHDHSACIIDVRGRAVALATHSQAIHLASMQGQVHRLLELYPLHDIAPGDIFISNDPYAAHATHLPDINFAAPVFHDGALVAFCCNVAHHADVGGIAAGSMSSNVEEIFQEGLRLPVVRLVRGGELARDLLDVILLNVRNPVERLGDYNAQIAACRLAVRRFSGLLAKYGPDVLGTVFDIIVARTERRMRAAIAAIPDGIYRFEDFVDDDGMGTRDIPIRVSVEVAGEDVVVDFAGTSAQVRGNLNCPMPATISATAYAIASLIDREIVCNEGLVAALTIKAEPGSLLNPRFPAPVAARTHTCQRIIDAVQGALAPVLPEAATGAGNGANTTAIFSGGRPADGKPFLFFETYGGGAGARSWKDGKDGVQVHITNTANTPVEIIETEFPLIVEDYALVADTGGAGRFRGGLGLRRTVRPRDVGVSFTGAGERFVRAPWGVFGGAPGAPGRFVIGDPEDCVELPTKPAPMPLGPDAAVVVQSPGAGGYGDPRLRTRREIARDWRSGKFSAAFIARHYGIDETELEALPFDPDTFDYDDA
jgi:N-methylhydantoinase B